MPLEPEQIHCRLREGGPVSDAEFDAWLPDPQRRVSYRFWTPVNVSLRVARWFAEGRVERVLDIGSGSGKFCVVGALGTNLTFTGVEHRPHLVTHAEELAHRFGVSDRASFVPGGLEEVDFRAFEALYFYNPFGEHRFPVAEHLDDSVEINRRRFDREVAEVERRLRAMPKGTRLATYNGYGGRIPDAYEPVHVQFAAGSLLRLWHKARTGDGGGYWLEQEASTVLHEASGHEQTLLPEPEDDDSG